MMDQPIATENRREGGSTAMPADLGAPTRVRVSQPTG